MVDVLASKASASGRVGSSPTLRTNGCWYVEGVGITYAGTKI
jgi:hypothetical protein